MPLHSNRHLTYLFFRHTIEAAQPHEQRRLPPEEEAANLEKLRARFSPTFNVPPPTLPTAFVTSPADKKDGHTLSTHKGPISTASALITTPTIPTIPTTPTTPTTPTNPTNPTNPTVHVTVGTPPASTSTAVSSTSIAKTNNATHSIATSTVTTADAIMTTHTAVGSTSINNTLSAHITSSSAPSVTLTTASSSIASTSASVTQVGPPRSGIDVVAIVVGTLGGLVGVVALLFIIHFLLNRRRKHNRNAALDAFDSRRSAILMEDPPPSDSRRSAILMEDPPAYDEITRFDSRLPTTERSLAPAPTFGNQHSVSGSALVPSDRRPAKHEIYS